MEKEIDMEEVKKSFERTDRIIAFKKALTQMIKSYGMDELYGVDSGVLAAMAVGQMGLSSSIAEGIATNHYPVVLVS